MGYAPTAKTVDLAEGADAEVTLRLREGGKVKVTVTDASGRPAVGVRVSMAKPDGSPARYWIENGGRPLTGADGTVTMTGVEPGPYQLSLFRNGSPQSCGKVSVEEGKTAEAEATLQ
jgi:hypothetical protein